MRELSGRRVLVVEDNSLIAWDLQAILQRAGCVVIGPCATLATAHRACKQALDAALVDFNINGETAMPLVDALSSAKVPVVFVTGHSNGPILDHHRQSPIVTKPFQPEEVLAALLRALVATPM
jgi:DNA-binding NtrC family response regulator